MNTDHLTRQISLIPLDALDVPVTIIGAGAIGSFVALALAKMGVADITVYDFDVVSVENMNNQFYRMKDIGTFKVIALRDLVRDFTGVSIQPKIGWFTPDDIAGLSGIVISAVDTMKARRMIFDAAKTEYNNVRYIIDPRMSAEFYTQYVVDVRDPKGYEKTLFNDSEAMPTPCTAKSTIYTALLAGGVVVKTIKNIILKEAHPRTTHWDINKVENTLTMFI